MNSRLEEIKRRIRDGEYKKYCDPVPVDISAQCQAEGLSWAQRSARFHCRICEAQKVVILPDEQIVFTRTTPKQLYPHYPLPPDVQKQVDAGRAIGYTGNLSPDWGEILAQGLVGRKQAAIATREQFKNDPQKIDFLDAAITTIDATLGLIDRYADEAEHLGRHDLAEALRDVPQPPRTFRSALQTLRFMRATLSFTTDHIGLGRFDQYLWPYLKADLDSGRLTIESAEELLAEYFISLNKDADIISVMQAGDNGQSLMLGGVTPDGSDAVNDLTWMVLRVSREVNMIDPKINLRITKDTPLDLLVEGRKLTRKGLGFPQYSNDDVVIPALISHGYDPADARNYAVAACWEFIVPGKGMDVPNIQALSFPAAADQAIRSGLSGNDSFEDILCQTGANIRQQVAKYMDNWRNRIWPPAPYLSVFMSGCLEKGMDVNLGGAKYVNLGIHGAGSANAADALAAVKTFVFEGQSVHPSRLLRALETNFTDDESLRLKLLNEAPKVGNDDDLADGLLRTLFDYFADACEAIPDNGRGGIVRPGTGTAMYYISLVRKNPKALEPFVGATADGRREGDFLASSLAPSPGVKVRGPLSVLRSFSKIDYSRIYNGGPITMELSDSVFRNEDAIRKVAMLVRAFAQLGCQQLQLNSLNVETLKDAKIHPERHQNLIVRVWGWSGYFCELEEMYQDHIISRNIYAM